MGCCSSSSKVLHVDENGRASKKQRTEERGGSTAAVPSTRVPEKDDVEAVTKVDPSLANVPAALPPGMLEMEPKELQPPQRPRAARAALLPTLVPVKASDEEIRGIFATYLSEVPGDLQKTLDCSWQHLVNDAKKAWDGSGQPLQWFWLMHPEAETFEEAYGLLVLWLQRGLTASHCVISHLSFKEVHRPWQALLPGVLETLRIQLFQMMPASSIRITLWYTPQEGKMLLDKEAEKPFREAGYRWFQLANGADSRRGQVMSQKRAQERDGKQPLELPDFCISSCLLTPGRRKVPVVDEVYREAAGNVLVLAESIRKHCAELQAATEPKVLQETLQSLRQVAIKGSGLVRFSRSAVAKDWQEFAAECFKDISVPAELLTWLCRERPESAVEGEGEATPAPREALCAGLALAVNWKAQRSDALDPEKFSQISVQATSSSQVTESPVIYLATEDDEISVMICKCSAPNGSGLYDFATGLLKEAPPCDFEDARAVTEIRLPRLLRCCIACTEAPQIPEDAETAAQAAVFDFTFARELFGFRLASRGTPCGALSVAPAQKVLTLDSDFLLAVWHEKYAELQGGGRPVPLFVALVRPNP